MYCPRCSSTQNDDIKFCTSCGANLFAVRRAVETKEFDEKKFNWGDTWLAEMFLSHEAQEHRRIEIERRLGITPEVKRYNEIKAGVIVSSVGVALMIFLWFFMQGIILGGKVPADTASILSHLWIAGIIPFFVGLALMINGVVIGKKLVEIQSRELDNRKSLESPTAQPALGPQNTTEFIPTSVTEHTTRHLSSVRDRDNDR